MMLINKLAVPNNIVLEVIMNKNWVPEILYEESGEDTLSSSIPFIPVPSGEHMPAFIFIFESRETGEFEPGPEGEDLPVTELDLHQYADMAILKEKLDPESFDRVRGVLGLEPLLTAAQKGKTITDKVRKNISAV